MILDKRWNDDGCAKGKCDGQVMERQWTCKGNEGWTIMRTDEKRCLWGMDIDGK